MPTYVADESVGTLSVKLGSLDASWLILYSSAETKKKKLLLLCSRSKTKTLTEASVARHRLIGARQKLRSTPTNSATLSRLAQSIFRHSKSLTLKRCLPSLPFVRFGMRELSDWKVLLESIATL